MYVNKLKQNASAECDLKKEKQLIVGKLCLQRSPCVDACGSLYTKITHLFAFNHCSMMKLQIMRWIVSKGLSAYTHLLLQAGNHLLRLCETTLRAKRARTNALGMNINHKQPLFSYVPPVRDQVCLFRQPLKSY